MSAPSKARPMYGGYDRCFSPVRYVIPDRPDRYIPAMLLQQDFIDLGLHRTFNLDVRYDGILDPAGSQ